MAQKEKLKIELRSAIRELMDEQGWLSMVEEDYNDAEQDVKRIERKIDRLKKKINGK